LSASELVQNLLKDLSLLHSVPINKIIIGGFSQVSSWSEWSASVFYIFVSLSFVES
jgi:hypothetical protein